jgi:peptidyl-prolyl cis-trans isomerase SurA
MKRIIFAFSLVIAILPSLMAQKKVVADKIVGVVGDKIILQSDIENAILDYKREGVDLPPDASCYLMEQQLSMKALVLQAERDSIVVEEDELEALLDNQIRGFIRQYGSKEILEEIAGRTIYQIKEDFRQPFRDRKLAEKMRDKIVANVKVTPQEVKAYFDKIPVDSLLFYESEMEIGEIVLYPKPSRDFELLAQQELAELKEQIESGSRSFEAMASLYSEDPGSKNTGGQYAINRNDGVFDPEFVRQAFRLREGQISPVFKTRFGYHIIKMESRAGDDAVIRHILRIPKVTQTEIDAAVKKLDSIRANLISGTLSFGEAVNKFSEDENSKFTAGRIQGPNGNYVTIDQLDKDLVLMLDKLEVNGYSQPQVYTDMQGKQAVRLVHLISRTEPHRENLKDDYNKIAQRALEEKKARVMQEWFYEKIPSFYVMVDESFTGCTPMQNWLKYAAISKN